METPSMLRRWLLSIFVTIAGLFALGALAIPPEPVITSNSDLASQPAIAGHGMWRRGFLGLGDAPPLFFTPSNSSCTLNPTAATGSISGTTLTISSLSAGGFYVGAPLSGARIPNGTIITAFGSGTGGTGSYTLNKSLTISSEAIATSGDGGSQVPSADGKCFLAKFPSSGVDVRQFGADPTGAADSAPAANAALALGSNHKIVFPPGTYTIKSTFTSPYPLATGGIGIGLFCTPGSPCSNIELDGEGATIATDAAHANIDYMGFAYWQNFNIHGFSFQSNEAHWPANSEPAGIIGFSMSNGRFEHLAELGNWGGSTKNPVLFAIGALTHVVFNDIYMPQAGECFDTAFLVDVRFSHIYARGTDDAGTGVSHAACLSIEYDGTTVVNYPSVYNVTSTNGVTIEDSVNISNFDDGVYIIAGNHIKVSGYIHDNPGGGGWPLHGAGVAIFNQTDVCCRSASDPVHDILIEGAQLTGNVNPVNIDATNQFAAETIGSIFIRDNNFTGTTGNPAIVSTGTHYAASSYRINGNALGNTTTPFDANTASLLTSNSWTPADASGASLTFASVSAKYRVVENIVFASFSLSYPATANTNSAQISGLPFSSGNYNAAYNPVLCLGPAAGNSIILGRVAANSTNIALYNAATTANLTNANLSGVTVQCSFQYKIGG